MSFSRLSRYAVRDEFKTWHWRNGKQLLLLAVILSVLFCLSLWHHLFYLATDGFLSSPVTITFSGLTADEVKQVRCVWNWPNGPEIVQASPHPVEGLPVWMMNTFFVGPLHIDITPELRKKLNGITVTVDSDRFEFLGPDPLNSWIKCKGLPPQLQDYQKTGSSSTQATGSTGSTPYMGFERAFLGYSYPSRADPGCIKKMLSKGLADYAITLPTCLLLIVLFVFASRISSFRQTVKVVFTGKLACQRKPTDWLWCCAGSLVVIMALAALELNFHYFFVEDDNLVQFLPTINWAAASLFHGKLATLNPYQLMGDPNCTIGIYSLTYPFTYLAYGIATYLLRDRNSTFEVFAAIHLMSGYLVMFILLRNLNIRAWLSALAAVSFVLSGFALIAGRSWYYMLPVAVWFPVLMWAGQRLIDKRVGIGWVLLTGLAIGLFFHAGNAQMWVYALLLLGITLAAAVATRLMPIKRAAWAGCAVLVGIAFALPLLLVQAAETKYLNRVGNAGAFSGIFWGAVFMPIGEQLSGLYNRYVSMTCTYPKEICYFGAIFALMGFATLAVAILRVLLCKTSNRFLSLILRKNIWLFPLLVATILTCGSGAILWDLLSLLPVFNKFFHSLKFMVYVAALAIIAGSLVLERLLTARRAGHRTMLAVLVPSMILLIVHLTQCNNSLTNFADRPYDPLPADLAACVNAGCEKGVLNRVMAICPSKSLRANSYQWLDLLYPTVYHVLSADGYDLLVTEGPEYEKAKNLFDRDATKAAQVFGVKWLLFAQPKVSPETEWVEWGSETLTPLQVQTFRQLVNHQVPELERADWALYRLPQSDPLAFAKAQPDKPLLVTLDSDGVTVDVSKVRPGPVIVNFLARPFYVADLDGRTVTTTSDQYGRIAVELPTLGSVLAVRYCPPWGQGIKFGLVCLLLSFAGMFFLRTMKWH